MQPSPVMERGDAKEEFEELVLRGLQDLKTMLSKESGMLYGLQAQVADLRALTLHATDGAFDTAPASPSSEGDKQSRLPFSPSSSPKAPEDLQVQGEESFCYRAPRLSACSMMSPMMSDIKVTEEAESDAREAPRPDTRLARSDSARKSFVRSKFHSYRQRVSLAGRELRQARSNLREEHGSSERPWRDKLRDLVSSAAFSYFIMAIIVFNLLFLGVEVEVSLGLGSEDVPQVFTIVNSIVVCIFVLEAAASIVAFGCATFFCGKEKWWNLFDLVIIALSVVEMAIDIWAASSQTGQVVFMRSLRFARALRGVRVMRLLRYVAALRTLVLSILSSMGSLIWTAVLLVLVFYTFGVIITQLVSDYCRLQTVRDTGEGNAVPVFADKDESPGCQRDLMFWSSIPESMLTLFLSITGGLDYKQALDPLRSVSPIAVACYLVYVSLTVFAIVNVVTGVFCNTAIESAQTDKEIAIMKQIQKQRVQVETLRQFFLEMDDEETNMVSLQELQDALYAGKLSGFLESMGISTQDVWTLFMIIDVDKSGLIGLDEFVSGCMQLHGPAKSLHLAKMSHENKVTRQILRRVESMMKGALAKMERLLPAERSSVQGGWQL